MAANLVTTLRDICGRYQLEPVAIYRAATHNNWPIHARNERELREALREAGHFLPLPKEPAALANVLETSIRKFICDELAKLSGVVSRVGTERGYPDLEVTGPRFDDDYFAVDIKVARRSSRNKRRTQSRITLYTGNTYFMHPALNWSGMFRAFADYKQHLDVIVLYNLDENSDSRVRELEVIVQEPWAIASKQRSSTTREYIGAVMEIDKLREGKGEFPTPEAFYKFWRAHPFKVGRTVNQQLAKLLRGG